MNYFVKFFIYSSCLIIVMIALSGIDFEKIMRRNKVKEIQLLIICLSMALAYLISNFLIALLPF